MNIIDWKVCIRYNERVSFREIITSQTTDTVHPILVECTVYVMTCL